MQELLFGSLFALLLAAVGAAVLAVIALQQRALRARLERQQGAEREPQNKNRRGGCRAALNRIGRIVSPKGASRTLEEQLAQAGYYGRSASAAYIGSKVILLLAGIAGATFLVASTGLDFHRKLLLIAAGGAAMFLAPNLFVQLRRRQRRQEVRGRLPDAIDLLEICVSSGMGLDMAWNLVADEIRDVGPALADEMALTNLEIHLGANRLEATRHMAERTEVEEVSSFATLLVQSERFGTSIADALRAFAASVRENRSMRAQESAEKTAVKLLFPMVIFIFPAVMAVLVGPAAIRLAETIGGGW